MGTLAWKLSLKELTAYELSLGNFRLGTSAWDASVKNSRLGHVFLSTVAEKLALRNFSLGTSLGNFSLETFA